MSLVPRVLGDLGPRDRGPVMVCLGGIHGNEYAGVAALQRVFGTLESEGVELDGRFVGLSGNRLALARRQRYVDHDLNRAFRPERLARVRTTVAGLHSEDAELKDIDAHISDVLAAAPGSVHLLDLHSTSGGGSPFTVLDDTLANRAFAFSIPVPHVLGLEEEVGGTSTSYAQRRGMVSAAFESGQHSDPESVDRAEAAIWIALESSGVLPADSRLEVIRGQQLLERQCGELPDVVEVRYRHALAPGHQFVMEPGFHNFDPVRAGQLLATEAGLPVCIDRDARLLMPLYQGQGDDGFFVVHAVNPIWLEISAWLRRLHAERYVHWLPGVSRHPDQPGTLVIDTRRARWLAIQVFHLLGYRRERRGDHTLLMTRRGDG